MELSKNIDENRTLQLFINRDYTRIGEIINISDNDFMSYDLSQSDDYGFDAMDSKYSNSDTITFKIDVHHPLYFPLLHLLNGDKSLIIDDDASRELNKKYMQVTNEDNFISINFVNKKNDSSYDKFNVFVKNIAFDLRSKIDCQNLDTKTRLHKFFNETRILLQEEYHQVSIEEYIYTKKLGKMPYEKKNN